MSSSDSDEEKVTFTEEEVRQMKEVSEQRRRDNLATFQVSHWEDDGTGVEEEKDPHGNFKIGVKYSLGNFLKSNLCATQNTRAISSNLL